MIKSIKHGLVASAIAVCACQNASASITASVKNVCDMATELATKSPVGTSNDTYSSLLNSHFSASSCNGQQLLEQMRAQKAEKLTANRKASAEVSSAD